MNKFEQLKTNKEKEEYLSKKTLLRFHKDYTPKSLSELLFKFHGNMLTHYRGEGRYGSDESYTYLVNSGRIQYTGSQRSNQDTYRICKYYFPNITYSEVQHALDRLVQCRFIRKHYCSTVCKYVYSVNQFGTKQETVSKHIGDLERSYEPKKANMKQS